MTSPHYSAATKDLLDRRVAALLGVPRDRVVHITRAFIEEVRALLVAEGEVAIPRLGSLRVTESKVNKTRVLENPGRAGKRGVHVKEDIRVSFSKSRQLSKELKGRTEKNMEKLGVDETVDQEALEKRAAQGCPACGKKLVKHGSVVQCPTHGTEPFESQGDPWHRKRKQ